MTLFVPLLNVPPDQKALALLTALRDGLMATPRVSIEDFKKISGAPFAYWISSAVREQFSSRRPLESDGRDVQSGVSTMDDFRFLRVWWETSDEKIARNRAETTLAKRWVALAKGGVFSRYYVDWELTIDWRHDGRCLKAYVAEYRGQRGWGYHWGAAINGHSQYFRPGLTWPRRTQAGLSVKVLQEGSIFGDKGPAVFCSNNDNSALLTILAIANSTPFRYLVDAQMAFGSFEVGVLERTPIPPLDDSRHAQLSELGRLAWFLKRALHTPSETSYAFIVPQALLRRISGFDPVAINAECSRVQAEIDDIVFRLYGFEGEDRTAIEAWGHCASTEDASAVPADAALDEAADDEGETDATADDVEALLSWAVGVVFGRFDIRAAISKREMLPEPEPFDQLPTKSPGMVPDGDPPFMPCQGVLVDDPGHADDLPRRVTAVYERVSEPTPEPEVLRRALARDFFSAHIRMYSKSRRKAPIYWQLATPSSSYSVWLYVHAFTKDTLFRVQNDYVAPKLVHEQRRLEGIRAEAGPNPSSVQRKAIAATEAFVEELQGFLDEVKRVAPLWNPDLDDGVIINFAPLWRLVPQHKLWQKELKATWDALCAGTYDWAHLAMDLWPERVVPKCATDRSLAIAHGLGDAFWFEDEDGKWRPYETPDRPIDELVRERSSPAVKAALQSLLDALVAVSGSRRGRRGTSATNNGGGR